MSDEYEIVPFSKLRHVNIFLINISYRNFHLHNELEIFAVIGGGGVIRRGGSEIAISKGSIVLLNSGEAHEIDALGGELIAVVIQLSTHFLRDYSCSLGNMLFDEGELCGSLSAEKAQRLWELIYGCALCYIRADALFELRCVALLAELSALLAQDAPHSSLSAGEYQARKKQRARMNRIFRYLDENYSYNVRLSELAALEGVTTTYLSHFFSQSFGISFQEYLSNLRFEHAVRLMDDDSLCISEIAEASGFSDPKYMTKLFLRRFGCKPREFRERAAQRSRQHTPHRGLLQSRYSDAQSVELLESSLVRTSATDTASDANK